MKIRQLLFYCFFVFQIPIFYGQQDSTIVLSETDVGDLIGLSEEWSNEFAVNHADALDSVGINSIPMILETDTTLAELMFFSDVGLPIYYTTYNSRAALSTNTTPLHSGTFNLNGSGMHIGEWDGGSVRRTHEQLNGRVIQVDRPRSFSDHATHVAGTLIGDGTGASSLASAAKGMASRASLRAYDWTNDLSEMARYASRGGLISNHSYGIISGWSGQRWYGGTANLRRNGEDPNFGAYTYLAREYDRIANSAPYYLICKAAGNDANDGLRNGNRFLDVQSRREFTYNSSIHPGRDGDYDCIGHRGNAKNILTVGAVHDVTNYTGPSSVRIASFSSRGPADDGRIKPDIVGNGVGVTSSLATGNSSYSSYNGTSMATPNVAGSLLLLQEHHQKLNGRGKFLRSSTLKALAIHTAKEAGPSAGPDYTFGWGLLDATAAAEQITLDKTQPNSIIERSLSNGGVYRITVNIDPNKPFKATLAWNDPAASIARRGVVDDRTRKLVNDLDLRVSNGSNTHYPYRLNPYSPSAAATKGDNRVDNVEQVYFSNVSGSQVTITISHKGRLSGGRQIFSLIISELGSSAATCSDGIQNGTETGVDCGGSSCARCECFTGPFTLALTFDNAPAESSWAIKNSSGGTIHRSPSYSSRPRGSTTYVRNLNISTGNNYTFNMYDSRGDGLCCRFGNGKYRLTDSRGKVVAEGANFGRIRTTTFCVGAPPCSNPTNLSVSNITSNSARATWGAVSGRSYYRVAYKPDGASTWLRKTVYATSTTLTNLRARTNYTVAVRALCSGKSSGWILKKFRTSGTVCPDLLVSSFRVTRPSFNRIDYTYTFRNAGNATASRTNVTYSAYLSRNTSLDKYDIRLGGANALASSIGAGRSLSGKKQNPVGNAVSKYYYLILKIDSGNRLAECNERNNTRVYRIPNVTRPTCSKPTNLRTYLRKKTFLGVTYSNKAYFYWNHVRGALFYDVFYKLKGGKWRLLKRAVRTNSAVLNVSSKRNYEWAVRAYCSNRVFSSYAFQDFRSLADDEENPTLGCPDLTINKLKITSRTDNRIDYKYTIVNEGSDTARATVLLKGLLSNDDVFANDGDIDAGSTMLSINLPPEDSLSGTLGADVAINTDIHELLLLKVDVDNALDPECDELNNESNTLIGGTCIAPDNLNASDITEEGAILTWDAVSGAVEYDLAYTAVGVDNWENVTLTGTSYNVSELLDSTEYYWTVTTICGTDDFSEEAFSSFTTIQGVNINAEEIFGATCESPGQVSQSDITDKYALLSWTSILDAGSYEIRYRPIVTGEDTEVDEGEWIIISDILDITYPLTDLSPETEYEWEVRTECGDGLPSEWTSSSFTTLEDDCLSANFSEVNDTSMLSKVYVAGDIFSDGRVLTGRKVVMEASNSITLRPGFEAQLGSDYHGYIASCSLSNIVADTTVVDQRVIPIPMEEKLPQPQLEVFPNPLVQEATIRFYLPTKGVARVLIFDLNGQLLTEQKADNRNGWNTTRLDATQLPAGMYYVTLQTPEGVLTKKVMIVK